MAFLDPKERVFDVVLTAKGRELLSQNLLGFEFFAFSDDGVDYGGALTASLGGSGSVDEYIRRTFMFEAPQFRDDKGDQDFQSFLYTIPSGRQTLPEFITNFDETPDITAKRNYFIDQLVLTSKKRNRVTDPVAVVMHSTIPQQTSKTLEKAYAIDQQVAVTSQRLIEGLNVVGQVIGPQSIMLNSKTVLDTKSGLTQPLNVFLATPQPEFTVISVKKELEVVTGLFRAKIDLVLKSSEGETPDPAGYLIEVFESGSDGTLIKLFEENVEDVLEDNVLKKGFEKELFFDGDATDADLISEAERLSRRQKRQRDGILRRLRKQLDRKTRKQNRRRR